MDTAIKWYGNHTTTGEEARFITTANGSNLGFAEGSVVIDPEKNLAIPGITVIHYGNTRNR